ncbi:hypothetical protein [Roseivirga thermotolerans]|uniref:hypothetical protein n=1 Tax=Roseivirga thermotolerans TaxID=1758176 RepID=UPI00273F28C9|nr:hypothetical protein [Roseivirga thermotolerans]
MKHKSLQMLSIFMILISLILEVGHNEQWFELGTPEALFGVSLALVLISMSINVKIIRTLGIKPHIRKTSQLTLVIAALYAVAVFGLELI